jgi:uncharacterized protein YndB with AHSA1/START domain
MNVKIILIGIFLMTHFNSFASDRNLITPRDQGAESILLEKTISVSPKNAWKLWTDPEKLTTWLAPVARIELKKDGLYELFWEPNHPEQNSTIDCKIIDLRLHEMLVFQWKGPVQFAHMMNTSPLPTWVRVTFAPHGKNETTFRLEHFGWKSDPQWIEAKRWQRKAWMHAFSQL